MDGRKLQYNDKDKKAFAKYFKPRVVQKKRGRPRKRKRRRQKKQKLTPQAKLVVTEAGSGQTAINEERRAILDGVAAAEERKQVTRINWEVSPNSELRDRILNS